MRRSLTAASLALLFAGCAAEGADPNASAFADGEAIADGDKEDTGYITSLDAQEVELDLEGDAFVSSPFGSIERSPLELGQFALTYLRKNKDIFIQSLAEDYAHGTDQIEWLVDGAWVTLKDHPSLSRSKLQHFRMRKVSAVVMHPGSATALAARVEKPPVPKYAADIFDQVGSACADDDADIHPDAEVYWYLWNPDKAGCKAQLQTIDVKVARVLTKGVTVYPEYNKLTADKKIDALVIFGQVGHGSLTSSDYAFTMIRSFESQLKYAGFAKGTAQKGLRYTRTRRGITDTVDIYSPHEFAGLDDYAHIDNFDQGINSHEIIVYNGHSMLGASDFWARPSIYAENADKYQIFSYNGCLGYEYYVNPILEGKKDWANVDLVSNIVETPFAIMVQETTSVLSGIFSAAEHGGTTSWNTLLRRMNVIAAQDSFYGASGVRTNAFHP
jgi:hypothetical protein